MQVIFLDIDGVLNNHAKMDNGYCGIQPERVAIFNRLLDAVPDAMIVVSSAWRYAILNQDMTLNGFEILLLTHGLNCRGRVVGHTSPDSRMSDEELREYIAYWNAKGPEWRAEQVQEWTRLNPVGTYVVLDDLELDVPNFIKIDGEIGITNQNVDDAIAILQTKRVPT